MKKAVFLFIIVLVLLTGCSVKKTEELSSAEKFSLEYSISKDNPFEYVTIDEVLNILESQSGIIFFGTPDSDMCVSNAKILNQILSSKNISRVYYYNPKIIQEKNTKKYKQLIKKLENHLDNDDEGKPYLYLPDVYFVKHGEIIGHNNIGAVVDGSVDYDFLKKKNKSIKNKYLELIDKYSLEECTDC